MKNIPLSAAALLAALLAPAILQASDPVVKKITDPRLGITLLEVEVDLPSAGLWTADLSKLPSGLADPYLLAPQMTLDKLQGKRLRKLTEFRELRSDSQSIRQYYWAFRQYAQKHEGLSPKSLEDLDPKRFDYLKKRNDKGVHHLLSEVPMLERREGDTNRWFNVEPPEPLAYELHPAINDGKLHVLYANGEVRREFIDKEEMTRLEIQVTPRRVADSERAEAEAEDQAAYRLLVRLTDSKVADFTLGLTNQVNGAVSELTWSQAGVEAASPKLLTEWAEHRSGMWMAWNQHFDTVLLSYWLSCADEVYGVRDRDPWQARRRTPNRTSAFHVLGGRAAIRETLQMQDLQVNENAENPDRAQKIVAIDTIEGVGVKSHPFAEMLEGQPELRLPLAEQVPHDRLLAYFGNTDAILRFLDGGSDFIFDAGTMINTRRLEYGLLDRYLARFGMDENWMRSFLKSGAVSELGVMLPDLFLIDGTEVTVVCRLNQPALAAAALQLLGLGDLKEITRREIKPGEPVFWARQDDLLFVSTHQGELESALACGAEGEESLGGSAEFRYMLTQLPLGKNSQAYVYFSDPFIRRLTSPEVKIGQLRRVMARTEMEGLTAGALLRHIDLPGSQPTLDELVTLGYTRPLRYAADTRLLPNGMVESETYGKPAALKSLLANPVVDATEAEAKAYDAYRTAYTRFWRRFFDPIAIRLDTLEEGRGYEVSTFILPLVDNSMYRGLREAVHAAESGLPLNLPTLDPAPVGMLSINLNELMWMEWLDDMDNIFSRTLGLRSRLLDYLGPEIHIALADADPIIGTGSGDLAGMFGGSMSGVDRDEMLAISMVVSLLTRPCHILVNVTDAEAAREELRRLPTGRIMEQDSFLSTGGSLYRENGQDRWIYTFSLEGVLQIRFGIELKGDYLVISNLPLTHQPEVTESKQAAHNGFHLLLNPAACVQQLPGLFASAMSKQRSAALQGSAYLQPLLMNSYAESIEQVEAWYQAAFGFVPRHPARGNYLLQPGGLVESSEFGGPWRERQPAFDPADQAFGLLKSINRMDLSVQFEQDGLRATARWEFKEEGAGSEE